MVAPKPLKRWALFNDVTGEIATDCGPFYMPELFKTLREAKSDDANLGQTNGFGHHLTWRRVIIKPL